MGGWRRAGGRRAAGAGRAGRAEIAGEVLIQTAFPQNPLFDALKRQDYVVYANALIEERAMMHFPPTSYFALLKAEARDLNQVLKFLNIASTLARAIPNEVIIYDAIRPQMERLNALERAHLLMQANSRGALQRLLKIWIPQLRQEKLSGKIRWALDIDPLEF